MIHPVIISGNEIRRKVIDYSIRCPDSVPYYDKATELIERLSVGNPEKDCVGYALGSTNNLSGAVDCIFIHEGNPVHGDIVLYRDEKTMEFTHTGVYQANGMVASKFGTGPIFLHNIDDVPTCCGDEVYFSRLGMT